MARAFHLGAFAALALGAEADQVKPRDVPVRIPGSDPDWPKRYCMSHKRKDGTE